MRKHEVRRLMLVASAVLLIALAIGGCVNQEQALYVATDSYATTVSTLVQYGKAGLVEPKVLHDLEPYRAVAFEALVAWRAAIKSGLPTSEHVNTFNAAIWNLIEARKAALKGGEQ